MGFDGDEGIDGRMTRIKWCGWGFGCGGRRRMERVSKLNAEEEEEEC